MTKQSEPRGSGERNGAAIATIGVVGVLGVVVALLAIFQSHDSPTSARDASQQIGAVAGRPAAGSSETTKPQRVLQATVLKLDKVGKQGADLRRAAQRAAALGPTAFRVASFNVLGASHTSAGGNKHGWAPAPTRMGWAVSVLGDYNVDVVGLQEFEDSQYAAFMARTAGAWGVYPGGTDARAVRNSIAWRNDEWQLVDGETFSIPYFHGSEVPTPYVLLRNVATGREVYFVNVHNPATTGRWGDNQHWRDVAMTTENAQIALLQATGVPVVFTGDFNERELAFCRITAAGTMHAANGGTPGVPCAPPADQGIDWIFGSADVEFSDFAATKAGVIPRATDHPLVYATVTLPPDLLTGTAAR